MAKFQIATPGGYEVEVDAPDEKRAIEIAREGWQTMPRIIGKFDGNVRVFERPSGERYVVAPGYSTTDPAKVDEILQGRSAGAVSQSSIRQGILADNPVAARAGEIARGTPFVGSYLDEAVGAVAGPEAATGVRALSDAMRNERPGETLGLNLGGGLLGSAAMVAAAPARVSSAMTGILGQGRRASQMARGAIAGGATGAAEGAIYGAGEGQEGTRAQEAVRGAQIGGTFGGLLGGATPLVNEAAENIIGSFRRSDVRDIARNLGISRQAATVIKNTFEQGGDMQAALQNLDRAGSEAMLADAGQAAQALLDATKASGGLASQTASSAIEGRATRSNQMLTAGLDRTLGLPAEGPRTAVQEIQRQSGPTRTAAYNDAFSQVIDYAAPQGQQVQGALSRIDPSILRSAVGEANEELRSRGMKEIPLQLDSNGNIANPSNLSVRQLNEIKKALDALGRNARDPRTGVETQQSLRYGRLARELRESVVEATGGTGGPYAEALRIGGDTIAERNAFSLGERLLSPRTNIEDLRFELGDNPSKAQIEAAKLGLRTELARVIGEVRAIPSDPNIDARQALATLRQFGSDNAKEKLRRLLGPDAEGFIRTLDAASASAELRAATSVNSRTFGRGEVKQGIDEMTQPGAIGQLMQGEPINTSKELIRAVTGQTAEYTARQRQQIYADLARALTEKTGDQARGALRMMDRAMAGQALTDQETEMLARMIASGLYGTATPALTRTEADLQRSAQ